MNHDTFPDFLVIRLIGSKTQRRFGRASMSDPMQILQ